MSKKSTKMYVCVFIITDSSKFANFVNGKNHNTTIIIQQSTETSKNNYEFNQWKTPEFTNQSFSHFPTVNRHSSSGTRMTHRLSGK